MKLAVAVLALALFSPPPIHADLITDGVADTITQYSVMPLGPGVALELAENLMAAQASSSYAASEPDSLTLSVDAVLRAIGLEVFPGGPTTILNAQNAPIPFIQSNIAIDDRAGVTLSVNGVPLPPGSVIDFGKVAVLPEPPTLILLLVALAFFVGCTQLKCCRN